MLITKVELEDVKSYHHRIFEFERGTTAITGANGAGKTTIIEAIAWALFDFLEYNQEDFARRGTKRGAVRVTFQSGLDNQIYTVYRDTSGKHWVYDEAAKGRVAEQNKNVVNFLKKHLQVEPGTKLNELYRAAIGVPQGTFTAVFLDNATTRKTVFDRLIKVEEYREGAKKLGETVNLIKDKVSEVKMKLAVAENELAKFDETTREHEIIAAEIAELEKVLLELRGEIARRGATVGAFETAKNRLETVQIVWREIGAKHQNAVSQFSGVERERDAAQAAAAKTRELAGDYQIFVNAEIERAALEREREERDSLKAEQIAVERNLINAKADNQSLERDLTKAIDAGKHADALAPQIAEQEKLEIEFKILVEGRAEANAAKRRAAALETEIAAKRSKWRELSESIKDGERGAGAAGEIKEIEKRREMLESELQQNEKAAAGLKVLLPQRGSHQTELEKSRVNLKSLETQIFEAEKFSAQAEKVGELVASENLLTQNIANLRAAIDVNVKFMREVKNGLCPILSQKCLNIAPGETLETYFSSRNSIDGDALRTFETRRQNIAVELKTARDAERNTSKLQTLREQAAQLKLQIGERGAILQNTENEIQSLANFTPEKQNALRIQKTQIDENLKSLREAALKFAALEGLREQIQNLKDEGVKLGEEQKTVREAADKLTEIEREITANQNRLRELDNPKAQAAGCRREAAREGDLKISIAEITRRVTALAAEKQRLDEALIKFAALDEKLAAVNATLIRTQIARDEFLRNQTIAEKLPELETALAALIVEVERLKIEFDAAQIEHEAAQTGYNAEEHAAEKSAFDAARTNEAGFAATLTARNGRQNQLVETLKHLGAVRLRMHDDLQEADKLRQVGETTDYIRKTLKDAAPHVGEIMRYEIARAATLMFRDVTGEVGRSLKWTDDYEIILDENGYQRPFANLSGGEQMAAALSIRLSLLQQLSDVRIAFFDEPTTNLDKERRERLAEQLGQITSFNQLFVISHDDTFANAEHAIAVG